MQYVISIAAVCPMRAEASHKSEMVSQLLFGEAGAVLEEKGDFTRLRCAYDGYEGWCTNSQLAAAGDVAAFQAVAYTTRRSASALLNGSNVPLSLASPVFAKAAAGNYTIEFEEGVITTAIQQEEQVDVLLKQLAWQYLNTPYLWGGKSSVGIDCSGFTQQVYKMMGIALLRDACQQATQGEAIDTLASAQCGDLAFFDSAEGRITHVGILLDSETIIHASGYVRIDKIDERGITHSVTGNSTHNLKAIKRHRR